MRGARTTASWPRPWIASAATLSTARLSRAGELSPADHLAVMYGKPAGGCPWQPTSLKNILLSEATLGYLMHEGKPVIGQDGNPVRLCEGLWDRQTHEALKKVLIPRKTPWIGRRSGCTTSLTMWPGSGSGTPRWGKS